MSVACRVGPVVQLGGFTQRKQDTQICFRILCELGLRFTKHHCDSCSLRSRCFCKTASAMLITALALALHFSLILS